MKTVISLKRVWMLIGFMSALFAQAQVVKFTTDPNSLCKISAPVIFTNVSTGLTTPYTWTIDFGDGTPPTTAASSAATMTHFYSTTGVPFLAQMTVSSSGLTYSAYVQIYAGSCSSPCPMAGFTKQDPICYKAATQFFSTSYFPAASTTNTYSWNFDDPVSGSTNTSTLANPTHIFLGPGPFTVSLTVSATVGGTVCTASTSQTYPYQTAVDVGATSINSILSISPSPVSLSVASTYHYTGPAVIFTTTIVQLNFGGGTTTQTLASPSYTATKTYTATGSYDLQLTFGHAKCLALLDTIIVITRDTIKELPCADCISSFAPIPGKKYLISAWVKEESAAQSKTSYTNPKIIINYPSLGISTSPFLASGMIIDGWQRVEGEFTIPASATDLKIQLMCASGNCFFDDVRVQPFDGSMKSYVYDPVTMRLVAELDERNYAMLYEYDEEGRLIRVKKETKVGKSTIVENRNNTKK